MKNTNKMIFCCLLLLSGDSIEMSLAQVAKLPTKWTKIAIESAVPLSEYPRPQIQRNDWMCLNGKWDYVGGKQITSALNPSRQMMIERVKEVNQAVINESEITSRTCNRIK